MCIRDRCVCACVREHFVLIILIIYTEICQAVTILPDIPKRSFLIKLISHIHQRFDYNHTMFTHLGALLSLSLSVCLCACCLSELKLQRCMWIYLMLLKEFRYRHMPSRAYVCTDAQPHANTQTHTHTHTHTHRVEDNRAQFVWR